MRHLMTWSVRVRAALVAVAVGIVVLGVLQLPQAPVDTLPEFARTTVEVQTEALGLSAREVEQLVTVPLEQNLLNGVAFLEEIESSSLPGLSSVVMTFEPGTPLLTARQVVTERLTQAAGLAGLAQVAKPPQMLQPRSSTSRVAMIRLSSPEQSLIELSVLARWIIVPRLLGVEGVANVAIWGFRDRQVQVLVDPEILRRAGVSLSQIVSTTGNALDVSPLSYLEASSPGTGGWIETVNQRLHVFHEQAITSASELEQVPIETPAGSIPATGETAGQVLTLGDVSEVVEDHQPLIGDAYCLPSERDCLLLVVEGFPDTNTLEVARELDATMETLLPGLGAVEVDSSIYRPAEYIETSFLNLGRALAIGVVLLLGVLFVFYRDWRAIVVAVVAVPVSLTVAALVLLARDVTINMMIVAGLMLGLAVVVDDSVVAVDRVARRLGRADPENGAPAWRQVVETLLEIRSPLLYGTVAGAVAVVPLFFIADPSAVFLSPLISSYLLALVSSLIVALTVTPAMAVLLMAGHRPGQTSPSTLRFERARHRVSQVSVRPRVVGVLVALLFVLGLLSPLLLDASFRPTLQEGDVLVHVVAEPGTSLVRMDQLMAQAIGEISALPGVASLGAHVGRAVASDQIVNVNSGEIWISLDESADHPSTLSAVESAMERLPAVTADVLTYSEERVSEVLPEIDPDRLTVRVYGENPDLLQATAEEVRAALARVEGVVNPFVLETPEESTIEVEVNLEAARSLGVSPGDVRRSAAILLSGLTVGNMFDEQKVFDVVVWGQPEIRQSETQVAELLIETPSGHIRLDEVADVRLVSNPTHIRHHSVMTYRDVVAEVPGGATEVAVAVEQAIDGVDYPLEYHAEVLGLDDSDAGTGGTWAMAVAAAIGVFLLFQAAFASWRLAALAFVSLALVLSGGLGAILFTGGTITLGSLAGLGGAAALAARVLIVLIGDYRRSQREGNLPFGPRLVSEVTAERVSPIVYSALGIAALFLPFVVNARGFEILQPAAIALLGALITTVFVALIVVPALYLRFGDEKPAPEDELVITLDEVARVNSTR